MALIAKRKVGTGWREAVAARATAEGVTDACLADYDARVAGGAGATDAAYRALQAFGLLWEIDLPGDAARSPTRAGPSEVPVA